ncbi:MAG: FGGY-family carbohydrate kinase [Holophagaceae bacterium]|nr:FGGY-family carbohydrate kinase [Holophagaceae bacterium]
MDAKQTIAENRTALGIELGSTRIKAVLIDEDNRVIAASSHEWENRLEDGNWTYSLDDVWSGLQNCFAKLSADVNNNHGLTLTSVGAIGISAMMHGYMAFDKNGNQLVPFRTWRNTTTEKAAAALTDKFQFNIPQRWSAAHLYQAVLNGEHHVKDIDFLTTLAGYVHWKLTGRKVLGLDDASGMFPIDSKTNAYDSRMLKQNDELLRAHGVDLNTVDILPEVLGAGVNAGCLTEEGAQLLDQSGNLVPGIPFCPPEGDAGTGMVATNAITERTGNVSAGTSIFAMLVLEKNLSKVYQEIDMVATPSGRPVAMVHCNNCTTDIDAWVKLFKEMAELCGTNIEKDELYYKLYNKALEGDDDCGNLLSYNYYAGEPITGTEQGRPLFVRMPDSNFSLANFMRMLLFSTMGTLKYGIDILIEKEKVKIDSLLGHGGLFRTKGVGQRFMAAAFNAPVSVIEESAGEGGAWGIALLAAYMLRGKGEALEKFLNEKVFAGNKGSKVEPDPGDVEDFKKFMVRYSAGLDIERVAVDSI